MHIHSFLYKSNFIRTNFDFGQNKKTKKKQIKNKAKIKVRHTKHKRKVSRLAILKITRTEHQDRTWLWLIYCTACRLVYSHYSTVTL